MQLQGGKMRRDCWDDTEALDFSHIYLETILLSNPPWTLSPLCFKFLNGRRCLRACTTSLCTAYWISQPRILPFMPALFCSACHLSEGLQWMYAASAFCLAWKYIIPGPSTGAEALQQKKDKECRLRNPDANWNFNTVYATTPSECSLEGKSITAQTIKSYIYTNLKLLHTSFFSLCSKARDLIN